MSLSCPSCQCFNRASRGRRPVAVDRGRPVGSLHAMSDRAVSELFDAEAWREVPGFEDLTDLTYHRAVEHGTVRVAFDRPEVRNAFRPHTVDELLRVLEHARMSSDV